MVKISILLLLLSGVAYAKDYRLLDTEKISFEGWRTKDNRNPYIPTQEDWSSGGAINFDLTVAAYRDFNMYWDNRAHFDSTQSQVRAVGWQYELGFSYSRKVDVFWYHHSQHVLEEAPTSKYPLENKFGFRLVFFDRAAK